MTLWGLKGQRILYINGKEITPDDLIQTKIINGLLVSVDDKGELICNGCLKQLRGRYFDISGSENLSLLLCISCFKLIQTLWRLDGLGLITATEIKAEEKK